MTAAGNKGETSNKTCTLQMWLSDYYRGLMQAERKQKQRHILNNLSEAVRSLTDRHLIIQVKEYPKFRLK